VVFRPKFDGATHLDELTREHDLALFVMFSSVAGTLGVQGQANYASANISLDALALRRRAEGLAAQSMVWGLWQQTSNLTEHLDDIDLSRPARGGGLPMPSEQGRALFDAACADGGAVVVCAKLKLRDHSDAMHPLLRGLARPARRAAVDARPASHTESL